MRQYSIELSKNYLSKLKQLKIHLLELKIDNHYEHSLWRGSKYFGRLITYILFIKPSNGGWAGSNREKAETKLLYI